jgi:hypothetical protein
MPLLTSGYTGLGLVALAWISTERHHANAEFAQMTLLTQIFGSEYYPKRCADASHSRTHLPKSQSKIGQIAHCSDEEPARNRVMRTPDRITKTPYGGAKKNPKMDPAAKLRLGRIRPVEIQAS